jgi:hypothetical protein
VPPALADELQQAMARAVVMFVRSQMLDQLINTSSQDSYLYFR